MKQTCKIMNWTCVKTFRFPLKRETALVLRRMKTNNNINISFVYYYSIGDILSNCKPTSTKTKANTDQPVALILPRRTSTVKLMISL